MVLCGRHSAKLTTGRMGEVVAVLRQAQGGELVETPALRLKKPVDRDDALVLFMSSATILELRRGISFSPLLFPA